MKGIILALSMFLAGGLAAQDFTMGIYDQEFRFDNVDGLGTGMTCLAIKTTDGAPRDILGFTASVENDPVLLTPSGVVPGPDLEAATAPGGPDFFAVQLFPNGVTIAAIFDFLLAGVVPVSDYSEMATLNYDFTGALAGTTQETTTFLFLGLLGDPLVFPEVLDDAGVPVPVLEDVLPPNSGAITFVAEDLFFRGDLDGDEAMTLNDPVLGLRNLFEGLPIGCEEACDADDSGSINLVDPVAMLRHQFAGDPPLPDPFGACGVDPTADDLTCQVRSCP